MIIEKNGLEELRKNHGDKKIVLALGSFDLFHFEHLRYLKDAKALGDILVVAIKEDEAVKAKGKNRPFMKEEWRCAIVDELKCVDYVYLTHKEDVLVPKELNGNEDCISWWQLFSGVFKNLQPDTLYFEINEKLQLARDLASKFFNVNLVSRVRTAITSTTKIIEQIKAEK